MPVFLAIAAAVTLFFSRSNFNRDEKIPLSNIKITFLEHIGLPKQHGVRECACYAASNSCRTRSLARAA